MDYYTYLSYNLYTSVNHNYSTVTQVLDYLLDIFVFQR